MNLLGLEEINQQQKSILKLLIDLDVLPPHNLCSYPEKDQPYITPEIPEEVQDII